MTDRYAPTIPFPSYAFVPGKHPHPMTDPQGHSFGSPHGTPPALNPAEPNVSQEYLFAIDLFNAGFYWEAHEAWEGLWIAVGRQGMIADFLKGLIKLAAAGVKAREGSAIGVERHARRALELFESVRESIRPNPDRYAGMDLSHLMNSAQQLCANPIVDETTTVTGRCVLAFQLILLPDPTA